MAKIEVWKCDYTGKLFEDEDKYKAHLKKLSRERVVRRKIEAVASEIESFFANLQNTVRTTDELALAVIEHQEWFWKAAARYGRSDWEMVGKKSRKGVVFPVPRLVRFKTWGLKWSDWVSNSHSCPHNGVHNWGGREVMPDGTPAPRGYPGWHGRVDWEIEWPKEWEGWYLGSDLFKSNACRIHTGSGGGGGWGDGIQSFGYDFRLFAADWPKMAETVEKQKMWKALGGNPEEVTTC